MNGDDEFTFEYDIFYDSTRYLSGDIQETIGYTGQDLS